MEGGGEGRGVEPSSMAWRLQKVKQTLMKPDAPWHGHMKVCFCVFCCVSMGVLQNSGTSVGRIPFAPDGPYGRAIIVEAPGYFFL